MTSNVNRVPRGPKPNTIKASRIILYSVLVVAAFYYLLPLYVMVMTSFKDLDDVRQGNIFALPLRPSLDAWFKAWDSACTGLYCEGLKVGFWNSVQITVPSVIASIVIASINGYALSYWRFRGSEVFFTILIIGSFIPYQVMLYPLVIITRELSIFGTLTGAVFIHTIFGMPILTLLFRNYFAALPVELFKAARVDGAGFWGIFFKIMLPLSIPIVVVAIILQVTCIWNDFLFGVSFSQAGTQPITVALNNIVNSTTGVKEYNVDMAAAIIAALPTLLVYVVAGKYFIRGLTAGSVKG